MDTIKEKFKNFFCTAEDKKIRLLAILAQECAQVYYALIKINEINSSAILLNREVLFSMIANDTKKFMLHLVLRPHIAEMNVCAKNLCLKGETGEERFLYYIEQVSKLNFRQEFYKKYAGLEYVLKNFMSQYLIARQKFLYDFNSDRALLNTLTEKKHALTITHIESVGDLHSACKCTLKITFTDIKNKFLQFIYKPIDYEIDSAYQGLCRYLESILGIHLFSRKTLYFYDHCWIEYISPTKCQNKKEVEKFYNNLGALFIVTHFLNAHDIHFENIIASGMNPYLIDTECLLYSFPITTTEDTIVASNKAQLSFDTTILGTVKAQETPIFLLDYQNCGQDTMLCIKKRKTIFPADNLPKFHGEIAAPKHFIHFFEQGYRETASRLLERKSEFISLVTDLFYQKKSRIIIRQSYFYQKLLEEISHPLLNKNVETMKKYLYEQLKRNNAMDRLIEHEISDLMDLNIPYFYAYTNSRQVFDSKGEKTSFTLPKSGITCFNQKMKMMTEKYFEDYFNKIK
jgi:lantibiotic modifying enzyme